MTDYEKRQYFKELLNKDRNWDFIKDLSENDKLFLFRVLNDNFKEINTEFLKENSIFLKDIYFSILNKKIDFIYEYYRDLINSFLFYTEILQLNIKDYLDLLYKNKDLFNAYSQSPFLLKLSNLENNDLIKFINNLTIEQLIYLFYLIKINNFSTLIGKIWDNKKYLSDIVKSILYIFFYKILSKDYSNQEKEKVLFFISNNYTQIKSIFENLWLRFDNDLSSLIADIFPSLKLDSDHKLALIFEILQYLEFVDIDTFTVLFRNNLAYIDVILKWLLKKNISCKNEYVFVVSLLDFSYTNRILDKNIYRLIVKIIDSQFYNNSFTLQDKIYNVVIFYLTDMYIKKIDIETLREILSKFLRKDNFFKHNIDKNLKKFTQTLYHKYVYSIIIEFSKNEYDHRQLYKDFWPMSSVIWRFFYFIYLLIFRK